MFGIPVDFFRYYASDEAFALLRVDSTISLSIQPVVSGECVRTVKNYHGNQQSRAY